jgi:hypothetical protein
VLLEVGEHLVRGAGHRVAPRATGPPEEEERAALLGAVERPARAARVAVDRCIHERERELELGYRAREHLKVDRRPVADAWEDFAEELTVAGNGVHAPSDLRTDRVVVSREGEARHLGALGRRDERLGDEQVRLVREPRALGQRE